MLFAKHIRIVLVPFQVHVVLCSLYCQATREGWIKLAVSVNFNFKLQASKKPSSGSSRDSNESLDEAAATASHSCILNFSVIDTGRGFDGAIDPNTIFQRNRFYACDSEPAADRTANSLIDAKSGVVAGEGLACLSASALLAATHS